MSLANQVIPRKLSFGDTVAAVSLSWGGPGVFPYRYEVGKHQFEEAFRCRVVEAPFALMGSDFVRDNPKKRAEDLMWAFSNPEVSAIISTIGGEDSIRILPFIDFEVIKRNPKIFLGYSDSTVTHFVCLKAGIVSYYGPSFMSGFAENCGIHHYLRQCVQDVLFEGGSNLLYANNSGWTVELLPWENSANQKIKRKLHPSTGWKILQGEESFDGYLLGGCMNTLEKIVTTDLWPSLDAWEGAILFLETSESAPIPASVKRWLEVYRDQGILDVVNGILFGRPGGHHLSVEDYSDYDRILMEVVHESSLYDLPVISHMDFGHTDPMMVLPVGGKVKVDPLAEKIEVLSS